MCCEYCDGEEGMKELAQLLEWWRSHKRQTQKAQLQADEDLLQMMYDLTHETEKPCPWREGVREEWE